MDFSLPKVRRYLPEKLRNRVFLLLKFLISTLFTDFRTHSLVIVISIISLFIQQVINLLHFSILDCLLSFLNNPLLKSWSLGGHSCRLYIIDIFLILRWVNCLFTLNSYDLIFTSGVIYRGLLWFQFCLQASSLSEGPLTPILLFTNQSLSYLSSYYLLKIINNLLTLSIYSIMPKKSQKEETRDEIKSFLTKEALVE